MSTFRIVYVGRFGQGWATDEVYLTESEAKTRIHDLFQKRMFSEKSGRLEVLRNVGDGKFLSIE